MNFVNVRFAMAVALSISAFSFKKAKVGNAGVERLSIYILCLKCRIWN